MASKFTMDKKSFDEMEKDLEKSRHLFELMDKKSLIDLLVGTYKRLLIATYLPMNAMNTDGYKEYVKVMADIIDDVEESDYS